MKMKRLIQLSTAPILFAAFSVASSPPLSAAPVPEYDPVNACVTGSDCVRGSIYWSNAVYGRTSGPLIVTNNLNDRQCNALYHKGQTAVGWTGPIYLGSVCSVNSAGFTVTTGPVNPRGYRMLNWCFAVKLAQSERWSAWDCNQPGGN